MRELMLMNFTLLLPLPIDKVVGFSFFLDPFFLLLLNFDKLVFLFPLNLKL